MISGLGAKVIGEDGSVISGLGGRVMEKVMERVMEKVMGHESGVRGQESGVRSHWGRWECNTWLRWKGSWKGSWKRSWVMSQGSGVISPLWFYGIVVIYVDYQ